MQQFLGHFRKQPRERLKYIVDYSPWLESGETIDTALTEIAPVTTDPLVVSNIYAPGDGSVVFYVEQGESGTQYQVTLRVTTSIGQEVEREIFWTVEEI